MVDAGYLCTLAAYGSSRSIWAFFHEIEHNHQSPDWTFECTGEVTLNRFTLYVFERLCGIVGSSDAWSDRDQQAVRFLRQVGRNLGPLLETWGVSTS